MEIDGYKAVRDTEFSYGEQYYFYKNGEKVGWMLFMLGILRVSTDISTNFLFHELYGDDCINEFQSGRERRKALRFAVKLLKEHYGEKNNSLKTIATIFPGAVVETQTEQQLTIF